QAEIVESVRCGYALVGPARAAPDAIPITSAQTGHQRPSLEPSSPWLPLRRLQFVHIPSSCFLTRTISLFIRTCALALCVWLLYSARFFLVSCRRHLIRPLPTSD